MYPETIAEAQPQNSESESETETESESDLESLPESESEQSNLDPGNPNENLKMAAAEKFITDPFQGDINPGTEAGAKLFNKATGVRDLDDKMDISQDNVTDIISNFSADASAFYWGNLVTAVPTAADNGGLKNILTESQDT